jgi:hypothetical protein
VPFKWRIVRLNNDAFLLTGEEIIAEPDTTERKKSKINPAEFIDFFQNAPIALHWLSGINVTLDFIYYTFNFSCNAVITN